MMTTRTIQLRALALAFLAAIPLNARAAPYIVVTRILAASGTVTGGSINCHNNTGTCLASFSAPATFTAIPDSGYAVDHWSGCTASSDQSTCSVPGTASLAIYVYFKSAPTPPPPPNTLDVRIIAASGGVSGGAAPNLINCYDNTGTCKMTLSGPVTLSAMPDDQYTVASWSGCTASADLSTCAVPGTSSAVVSISFKSAPPPPPTSYTLVARILSASGTVTGGGISCSNNTGTCGAQEPIGGTVTLAAVPSQGFATQSWSGCTPSADLSTCTVTMNANTAISASFVATQGCIPNKAAFPRFVDNGDLTVTDFWTCLMWEKKTGTFGSAADYTDAHNVNNFYTFGTANNTAHDGTVFNDFLAKLNAGTGLAGHTDWRLPKESNSNPGITNVSATAVPGDTVNEMEGILPLDPIFGSNALPLSGVIDSDYYWTGSTGNTSTNWAWHFSWAEGTVSQQNVQNLNRARAVRSVATVPVTMYSSGNDGSTLYAINTETGAATAIGPTNYPASYGVAVSPSGTLYTFAGSNRLATINPQSGAVAAYGVVTSSYALYPLAFAADGTLYAADYAWLYTVDVATGALTTIGQHTVSGIMDIDFDSHGQLWAIGADGLSRIDASTAATTHVASFGNTCFMGLAIRADDRFFVTDYCSSNSPLYRLDIANQQAISVGLTGISSPHGGAFAPPGVTVH